jgi:CBS domain-containing protein
MAVIVNENLALSDALEEMKRKGSRLIFVIDNENKLVGVISQGDLLKLSTRSVPVSSCMEMNPVYLFEKDRDRALEVLKKYQFSELPILSEEFTITDVVSIWELA